MDRRRVVEALNKKFEEDRQLMAAGAARRVDTSLKSLMMTAPPAKQFVNKPVITEREALAMVK